MAQQLKTDIVLNLAGNLAAKARQYGASMSDFAKKNETAMGMIRRSAEVAGRGIDTLGNRYVGVAAAFATGATVRNVGNFSEQMTRLGTNAKLTDDQVDLLKGNILELANQKDIRVDTTQFTAAVDELLGKTGDFEFVNNNLENMGLFMQAFGADAKSSGALFAQFREKGIKDAKDVMNTVDDLYSQFAIGSVNVKDLAAISEQLFATYQGKGPEAITQMASLVQLFAKAKGNANESLTSIQGVFAAFSDKTKVEFLDKQGIAVFKAGTKELREPVELLLEILDKAKNDPLKLSEVFDQNSLQGLASLYSQENKDLLLQMNKSPSATFQGTGPEAITQMSSLVQLLAEAKGNADESLTSIEDVFAAFNDKTKVEFLDKQGIAVFKAGTKELREPVELLLEILDKAKNDPLKLGDVFDQNSVKGLASLYSEENEQLLLQMDKSTGHYGETQKAAAKNAAEFNNAVQSLTTSFNQFAESRLSQPIRDIADAINSVDDETIDNWLKWGEAALWVVGGLVAAKKAVDAASWVSDNFGSKKKAGAMGGKGGFADMGVMPVYVVNMGAGGMAGAAGIDITDAMGGDKKPDTSKWSKVGSTAVALGTVGYAASMIYENPDAWLPFNVSRQSEREESIVNLQGPGLLDVVDEFRDFRKWAKATTLADVLPSLFGDGKIQDVAVKPAGQANITDMSTMFSGVTGQLNLKLDLSDSRPKLTATKTPPGILIDPDTGAN